MPRPRVFVITLISVLVLLNAGSFLLRDIPMAESTGRFMVPKTIMGYHGEDLALPPEELAILAPAKTINRKYEKISPQPTAAAKRPEIIWLNLLETGSLGSLHNFYDSLIASGSRPTILKTLVIATRKGPLRTSLIRYYNVRGQAFYLLLWYQWTGGTSESRWRWYADVLALRIQGKKTPWRLVEVATPQTAGMETSAWQGDVYRLARFAKALYESSDAMSDKP